MWALHCVQITLLAFSVSELIQLLRVWTTAGKQFPDEDVASNFCLDGGWVITGAIVGCVFSQCK